ncbi:hypothetical protein [Candidatus Rhodobacter oscarellae]|uniref:hypothetical protein n=1 Tax=Candidatus Rhodobacter oscarellae TaxID=1675527 RepID=UPI000670825D|nr:hypothetical protein [Candidatus Rhodobacter lobularis]
MDRDRFRDEIQRLEAQKLHIMHRRTLDLMSEMITDKAIGTIGSDIPVYVSRDLHDAGPSILKSLQRWARTPELDFAALSRVDVIRRDPTLDYAGLYRLYFSGIVLVWPMSGWGPRRWIERIMTEHTFYHEIGHHAHGHIEGGRIAEQEKEADAYARQAFRRAPPVATTFLRWLFWPLWGLSRWVPNRRSTR